MSILLLAPAAMVAASAGRWPAQGPRLLVHGAWARPSLPGRPMSAVYAVLENPTDAPVALTAVSCDAAGMSHIHESFEDHGMMRMRPVDSLLVSAHDSVELKPGGYHIMLMMLRHALAAGDHVRCELRGGERVLAELDAVVRAQ
jgi:copper(I)-binding protein